jgi:hypothetical protein
MKCQEKGAEVVIYDTYGKQVTKRDLVKMTSTYIPPNLYVEFIIASAVKATQESAQSSAVVTTTHMGKSE